MVVMTVVPQACGDDEPSRISHEHQQDDAREHETALELVLAVPSRFRRSAFGETGGFLW